MTPLTLRLIAAGVLVAVLAGIGWKVNGWRQDAARLPVVEAERDAEQIRGEGDARASDIYAQAFGKNVEFYTLYRSLNAYKKVFRDDTDVLLLQPDSEFFKYFKQDSAN